MKKWVRFLIGIIGLLIIAVVVGSINAATGAGVICALVIPGFTDEQSKSFGDFIEKQSVDIQEKVKGLIASLKDTELIKGIQGVLNGEGENKGKGIVGNMAEMQKQLDDISTQLEKSKKEGKEGEELPLYDAMKQLINSDAFKAAKANKFAGKPVFQVKASTSDITGTVNRTVQRLNISFAPDRALAFLPFLNVGYVGQDKSRVLWVEGAYTSNVGYVAEGTGQPTADTGTATEKTRGMAKISAKLPLTAELLEDADYIASAFKMKMQDKAMIWTDGQAYTGDGSDSPNPTHIYGIQGHATAFNATTAGALNSVEDANIGDLVDAGILQAEKAEQRGLNVMWINPSDFYKLKKTKDQDGQYLFVKDINGQYSINGLQVIKTQAVTANTMLLADTSKIQLWWKRNPEIKFSQMNGTDFIDDAYTAVMFLRAQIVVETQDKTALIYISDIDAEVANLNIV